MLTKKKKKKKTEKTHTEFAPTFPKETQQGTSKTRENITQLKKKLFGMQKWT